MDQSVIELAREGAISMWQNNPVVFVACAITLICSVLGILGAVAIKLYIAGNN